MKPAQVACFALCALAGLIVDAQGAGTWVKTSAPSPSRWTSVASSSDGTKLAAVVYDGLIYTSTDSGGTWTPRYTSLPWVSIASSSDGVKLAAIVYSGASRGVHTSTDSGQTWVFKSAIDTIKPYWYPIASSSNGIKLAVGANGLIYTSSDSGGSWTPSTSPSVNWNSIASSSDGTKLVAAYYGGLYTSTDSGTTWIVRSNPTIGTTWRSVASSSDGTKLVAAEKDNGVYTSTDSGVSWTRSGLVNTGNTLVASSGDGTKLVAVGGTVAYTSTDSGSTWSAGTQISAVSPSFWNGVAASADGSRFLAAIDGDGIYTYYDPVPAPAQATGDPHLRGPDNTVLDFNGVPNAAYALFTSPALQINMGLTTDVFNASYITAVGIVAPNNATVAFDLTPMTPSFKEAVNASLVKAGVGVVEGWTPWRIDMIVCGGLRVTVSQMHAETLFADHTHTGAPYSNYYDVSVTPNGCSDTYGGALGAAYRCGADGRAAGWRESVREDEYRVNDVLAGGARVAGGRGC